MNGGKGRLDVGTKGRRNRTGNEGRKGETGDEGERVSEQCRMYGKEGSKEMRASQRDEKGEERTSEIRDGAGIKRRKARERKEEGKRRRER